jgi:hypothetical protein
VLENTEFSNESELTIPENNLLQSYSTLLNIVCLMEENAEVKAEESRLLNKT